MKDDNAAPPKENLEAKTPRKIRNQIKDKAKVGQACLDSLRELKDDIDKSVSRGSQMQLRVMASKIMHHPETPKKVRDEFRDLALQRQNTPEKIIMPPSPKRCHKHIRKHKDLDFNDDRLLTIMERHCRDTCKWSRRLDRPSNIIRVT